MADRRHINALADSFQKHLPQDTRFLFALIERNGTVTTMWTIQNLKARVTFLKQLLVRAREDAEETFEEELERRGEEVRDDQD